MNDDATKLAEAIEAHCKRLADRNEIECAWNYRGQLDRLLGAERQTHLCYQRSYDAGFNGQGAQHIEALASVVALHVKG